MQVVTHALGGVVEAMAYNEERPKILGRELIKTNEQFFEQGFVQRFMKKNKVETEKLNSFVL